jgi:hypothetical protein
VLYSPLNLFSAASYRYCRNEQCGSADAAETRGASAAGKTFSPSVDPQRLEDTITAWAWMDPPAEPVIVSSDPVNQRRPDFLAGIELTPLYHPSYQPYTIWAFQNIHTIGANTVILSPTWHMVHQAPPVMAPLAGSDPLWTDTTQMALQAQQSGLKILVHPQLQYQGTPESWWQAAPRDAGFWDTWFTNYRTFLLYHADLATQSGAEALIIGDDSLIPALPGGVLADGSSSNAPEDAALRWQTLLGDLRRRYTGKVFWLVSYAGRLPPVPDFLSNMDGLYIEMSAPLAGSDTAQIADLETSLAASLDGDILGLQTKTNLPIYLGLRHPSTAGGFDGCITSNDTCLDAGAFLSPAVEPAGTSLSLKEQADAYSALLNLVNQRSWITGFFAVGYHPQVELRDQSTSVRGKPALDALWYWYPRMLGQVTQ